MPACTTELAQYRASLGLSATKLAQHTTNRLFRAILSALGELFRARTHIGPRKANYFAHGTQRRGEVETNDTSATADAGQRETAITTAHP